MTVRVQKLIKMFFRNTLVAHKWLVKPYFMRFTVLEEIMIKQLKRFVKPLGRVVLSRGFLPETDCL